MPRGPQGLKFGPDMVWWMHNLSHRCRSQLGNRRGDVESCPRRYSGTASGRLLELPRRSDGWAGHRNRHLQRRVLRACPREQGSRPGVTRIESTQVADVVEDVAFRIRMAQRACCCSMRATR